MLRCFGDKNFFIFPQFVMDCTGIPSIKNDSYNILPSSPYQRLQKEYENLRCHLQKICNISKQPLFEFDIVLKSIHIQYQINADRTLIFARCRNPAPTEFCCCCNSKLKYKFWKFVQQIIRVRIISKKGSKKVLLQDIFVALRSCKTEYLYKLFF